MKGIGPNLPWVGLLVTATGLVGCAASRSSHSSPVSSPIQERVAPVPQQIAADEGRLVSDQGVVLRFDSELGVYVVVGESNLYFLNGVYYRSSPDGWAVAIEYDGPWQAVSREALPPGLRSKAASGSS